jgi:hypothetical protein
LYEGALHLLECSQLLFRERHGILPSQLSSPPV